MKPATESLYYDTMSSPIGTLCLVADDDGLCEICFPDEHRPNPDDHWHHNPRRLADARRQLVEYFAGDRQAFALPLHPRGTAFQQAVWQELARIPFGATRSYADIAQRIGKPTATRAVGAANGRNPIPIVIPCHRVIGADGSLTGYSGGLHIKRFLLTLEGDAARGDLFAEQARAQ